MTYKVPIVKNTIEVAFVEVEADDKGDVYPTVMGTDMNAAIQRFKKLDFDITESYFQLGEMEETA